MNNPQKICTLFLIFITCLLSFNSVFSYDKKKNLKYENVDWKNYHWWEKWYDFNPEVNYPESPKVAEYLKLEAEGKLPKNIHIYQNDHILEEYKEILLEQKSRIPIIMKTNIEKFSKKVLDEDYEFDSFTYNIFAKWINPPSIDFLLWLYNDYNNLNKEYNTSAEGLCIMVFWMTKDPNLFVEELLYFKKKVVPIFWERIYKKKYDIWILDALYRLGYEKEVLPFIIEKSKIERFEYQLLCSEYFSFNKKIRIAIAQPEIKSVVLKLLNNLDGLNLDTQYECILFLYLYGDLDQYVDYLFQIIDMKRYQFIDHYMKFFELLPKNHKVKKYFEINLEKPEFKEYHEKMNDYINAFINTKVK